MATSTEEAENKLPTLAGQRKKGGGSNISNKAQPIPQHIRSVCPALESLGALRIKCHGHGLPSSFPFYVAHCRENTKLDDLPTTHQGRNSFYTLCPQGLSEAKGLAPHQASETESLPEIGFGPGCLGAVPSVTGCTRRSCVTDFGHEGMSGPKEQATPKRKGEQILELCL